MFTKNKQIFILFFIYIGQILVGFVLGWTAPILPKLQDPEQTPLLAPISVKTASWVASVLYIGTILSPYVAGYLSNIIGRKPCLVLGGITTAFSFLILAYTSNLETMLVGRVISGLGTGIIFVMNIVYIGEITSTEVRGILLSATGMFQALGFLIVYSIGPYVSYVVISAVGLCITAVYVVGLVFVPETPLYLVMRDKTEKAQNVLKDLNRENEFNDIVLMKENQANYSAFSNWRQIFSVKSNRNAFWITVTLNILTQMSGVMVFSFFSTIIFESAGYKNPGVSTTAIGITQLLTSGIALISVQRSRKKLLLVMSTGLCCVSLAVLGLYFLLLDIIDFVDAISWLPLVSLNVFFISYNMGLGIIPGTLVGEMFQPKVRSTGSTVSNTIGWLVGFAVVTAFGYMIEYIGSYITFWIYSIFCAITFFFTLLCVPETRGKSLLEVQEILSR